MANLKLTKYSSDEKKLPDSINRRFSWVEEERAIAS
jgi:hypothetical protein